MTHIDRASPALTGQSYAVLRHSGASPERAQAELSLSPRRVKELEALFAVRRPTGGDTVRPRFARHDGHVAAVLALGGYPEMPK